MKETDLQRAIMDHLVMLGFLVVRINSGGRSATYTDKHGNTSRRWFWFSKWFAAGYEEEQKSGVCDLFALRDGRWWLIEVKLPAGKLRQSQKDFIKEVDCRGGRAIVLDSVEGLLAWLEEIDHLIE